MNETASAEIGREIDELIAVENAIHLRIVHLRTIKDRFELLETAMVEHFGLW